MVRRLLGSLGSLLVLLIALLACGRGPRRDAPGETIVVSATPAAAAVPPPPPTTSASSPPGEPLVGSSASSFDGDRLVACTDVAFGRDTFQRVWEMALDAGKIDGGMSVDALADDDLHGYLAGSDTLIGEFLNKAHGKGTATALRPKGKPTSIAKPCRQQFAARTIIASCRFSAILQPDAGPAWRLGGEIIYFDALGSDAAMKACLSAKGDWEELPKNSAEFLHEKHDQMFRRLMTEQAE